MGKVCIVGCGALQIDYNARTIKVGSKTLKEGDFISIDGFTGEVIAGQVATKPSEVVQVLIDKTLKPEQSQDLPAIRRADEMGRRRPQAQGSHQRRQARSGRPGDRLRGRGDRPVPDRAHVLRPHRADARDDPGRNATRIASKALAKLLPFQRDDFAGIFRAMKGLPVTIRTLDPPLHEFLPHDADGPGGHGRASWEFLPTSSPSASRHCTNSTRCSASAAAGWASSIPEITEMQSRAIFEAACNVQKEGIKVEPEIMIPLVGFLPELKAQAKIVHETAKKVFAEKKTTVAYLVGTMIELPRACVAADQIAKDAQFFSFGTNDLTQTGLGMSRDDYGSFIRHYIENDLIPRDPFQTIDFDGVGGSDENRRGKGPGDAQRSQDRHLRRARRRPGLGEVLPQDWAELRQLQPVPSADRPPGGGTGRIDEVGMRDEG